MSDENEIPEGDDGPGGESDAIAAFVADEKPTRRAELDAKPDKPEKREAPERREREPEKREAAEAEEEADKPEKPAEKPPEKRRYKVKVDGEDLEVDEDELQRGYARNRSVTQRSQKVAEDRRRLDEAMSIAKKDPARALQLLGLSPDEYRQHAERMVWDQLQSEVDPRTGQPLTDEQKRIRKLEAENTRLAADRKADDDKRHAAEEEQAAQHTQRHWLKTIVSALETRKEPKWLVQRVAGHLAAGVEGDQALDPQDLMDDAIDLALEDLQAEHSRVFDAMEWPEVRKRFPKLVDKIRKGIVADYKAGKNPKPEPVEASDEGRERRRRGREPERFATQGDAFRAFVQGK